MLSWPNFLSQTFNGLVLGALLALLSSGLTIIYGTLGVLNLAHGAMFMVGGYAGVVAYQYTGSYLVAVAAGAGFVLVLGRRDGADRHPAFLRSARRGSNPRDVRSGHRLRRGHPHPVRQPVAIDAAAGLGGGHHLARLHDLSDLSPRGRRHHRARVAGALPRALSLAPGHDRARGNRGFGDGGLARHQCHAGLHGRVRHRLDGGRIRRHRQRSDRADHARHRRIDLGGGVRRRRDRRRRLVSRRGARRSDRGRNLESDLDDRPELFAGHAVRRDDPRPGAAPARPARLARTG